MAFDNSYALVIGIGTYDKTPRMNVPITAQDAESVAEILRDPAYCGYPANQVKLLHDAKATREGILAELDALATCTNADSTVFVFYAGHGEYDADGHFFLTTHDTVLDAQGKVTGGSGISEQELLTRIGSIPAKRAFLFFNACHSGDISPGMLGGAEEEPLHSGASLPDQLASALLGTGEGRVIITACRQDEKSYFLRDAPRTVFGEALAKGLQGKDIVSRKGYISLFDLYECVYTFVSERVHELWQQAQQPELTISKGVGVMAVALYHGTATTTGLTNADVPGSLGSVGAVREVETSESKSLLEAILEGKLKLGEQKTVNTGGGAHIEGSGHQMGIIGGNFQAPVVGIAQAPVTMGNSETVQGDKITTGNMTGNTAVAIGRGASAAGTTAPAVPPSEAERLRAAIEQRIAARPEDPNVDKASEIVAKFQAIWQEAGTASPNANKIKRWLGELEEVAPEIVGEVASALQSSAAGATRVANQPASGQTDTTESQLQTRRFEAAMPETATVGRSTEVRVMIALAESSGLRAYLPDRIKSGDLIRREDVEDSSFQSTTNNYGDDISCGDIIDSPATAIGRQAHAEVRREDQG
jgi:hypothetical protein